MLEHVLPFFFLFINIDLINNVRVSSVRQKRRFITAQLIRHIEGADDIQCK